MRSNRVNRRVLSQSERSERKTKVSSVLDNFFVDLEKVTSTILSILLISSLK